MNDFEQTKQLAEKGDANAQYNLGVMYENGQVVEQNDAEALRWYKKAAEKGHAYAKYMLDILNKKMENEND